MSKKVLLISGHEARSVLNKFPKVGAVLRKLGVLQTTEQRQVQTIASNAWYILKSQGYNVEICNAQYDLNEKIWWANTSSPINSGDIVLSLHLNSYHSEAATGNEVWYHGGKPEHKKVAEELSKIQSRKMLLRSRGAKPDDENRHKRLGILRDTHLDAYLAELCFLSNPQDMKKLKLFGVTAVVESVKFLLDGKTD